MMQKVLYECWCSLATKLIIYNDKVVIKRSLGINTITIPMSKLASVQDTFLGLVFETSGGGKTDKIQPWDARKKPEIVDLVLKLIEKSK